MRDRALPIPDDVPEATKSVSGVRWLGTLIEEAANVQVSERRASDGPLTERLLRGVVHQGARHAAVRIRPPRPGSNGDVTGGLTYHVDGEWEPTRRLPTHMVADLRIQLSRLLQRAEPSCDRGEHFTLSVTVPELNVEAAQLGMDHGDATFRLHRIDRTLVVVSPHSWSEAVAKIVDRQHAKERSDLFDAARASLERGHHQDAPALLEEALAMSDVLGTAAEQLCISLTLGCALELGGHFLRAERVYKDALKRIEETFGRDDLQRIALFERLAHSAGTRGDATVSEMWRLRAEHSQRPLSRL